MNLWLRLLRVRLAAQRGARISLWDTVATRFRVVPTDLDTVGHMNNGRYLTLLDLGRLDLMVRSGFWQRCRDRGWFPVVAGQTITYWKNLTLAQSFDVHTRVAGGDERWVYLEQTFRRGDVVHAHALIRACFVERGHGRVPTADLDAELGGFPDHVSVPDWVRSWTTHSAAKTV
ncbi:acyl-CoA thioesterase [Demequina aestuarii]|uniref:acyl-CoA thioesterase n=1 Tax=Demequina aestuarii TaxID=327095 RepID=UPI00078227EB|nr:acyl-CoA thioesterase [Demequina aestuarii]